MKKLFILIFAVFTTASLALPVWAAPVFMAGDKNHPVTVDNSIVDDAYIGADSAIVNANVDGDLIIGANTAQINGKVNGDLWIGAGTVTVNNRVVGDIRIGAGETTLNSTVDDDVIVGTGKLIVGEKALIKGDLIVGGGNVEVNGKVLGDAKIAGGGVTLKAVINGNVEIKTDNYVTILPGTKIGGELSYWAPKENADFVKYAKTVVYHPRVKRSSAPMLGAFMWMVPAISIGLLLWKLIGILLLGAVLIWLMPKLLPRVVGLIQKDYLKAFWQGLVFAIGVPILMLVLAVTLIGIQLTIMISLIYGLVMILGFASAAMLLGSRLVKKSDKTIGRQLGAFVAGSVLLGLIGIMPLIGWLVCFVLMMIGVGGFWQDRYKMFKTGKY